MEKITLAAIQEDYINAYSRYQQLQDVLQQKIKIRTKQIERLQHKLTRHGGNFPRWTENLLRPVLNRVKEQLPGWIADDGQLTPMGLGCRVSVFFHPLNHYSELQAGDTANYIYIVFLPGDLDKGELLYQTGEQNHRFAPGTIGEINGFNQVSKKLESIDEAVRYLQQQIKSLSHE